MVNRLRWILALTVAGWCLFASWGLILLFQLSRSRSLDPPTPTWSLVVIAASSAGVAALGPAIAARIVRRSAFYRLSALAAVVAAGFIVVLVWTT